MGDLITPVVGRGGKSMEEENGGFSRRRGDVHVAVCGGRRRGFEGLAIQGKAMYAMVFASCQPRILGQILEDLLIGVPLYIRPAMGIPLSTTKPRDITK